MEELKSYQEYRKKLPDLIVQARACGESDWIKINHDLNHSIFNAHMTSVREIKIKKMSFGYYFFIYGGSHGRTFNSLYNPVRISNFYAVIPKAEHIKQKNVHFITTHYLLARPDQEGTFAKHLNGPTSRFYRDSDYLDIKIGGDRVIYRVNTVCVVCEDLNPSQKDIEQLLQSFMYKLVIGSSLVLPKNPPYDGILTRESYSNLFSLDRESSRMFITPYSQELIPFMKTIIKNRKIMDVRARVKRKNGNISLFNDILKRAKDEILLAQAAKEKAEKEPIKQ